MKSSRKTEQAGSDLIDEKAAAANTVGKPDGDVMAIAARMGVVAVVSVVKAVRVGINQWVAGRPKWSVPECAPVGAERFLQFL